MIRECLCLFGHDLPWQHFFLFLIRNEKLFDLCKPKGVYKVGRPDLSFLYGDHIADRERMPLKVRWAVNVKDLEDIIERRAAANFALID